VDSLFLRRLTLKDEGVLPVTCRALWWSRRCEELSVFGIGVVIQPSAFLPPCSLLQRSIHAGTWLGWISFNTFLLPTLCDAQPGEWICGTVVKAAGPSVMCARFSYWEMWKPCHFGNTLLLSFSTAEYCAVLVFSGLQLQLLQLLQLLQQTISRVNSLCYYLLLYITFALLSLHTLHFFYFFSFSPALHTGE